MRVLLAVIGREFVIGLERDGLSSGKITNLEQAHVQKDKR
jgi:hypothetical protein